MQNRHMLMTMVVGLLLLTVTGCCGGRGAGALSAALVDVPEEAAMFESEPTPAPVSRRQVRR